jgi:hypothetical protein
MLIVGVALVTGQISISGEVTVIEILDILLGFLSGLKDFQDFQRHRQSLFQNYLLRRMSEIAAEEPPFPDFLPFRC